MAPSILEYGIPNSKTNPRPETQSRGRDRVPRRTRGFRTRGGVDPEGILDALTQEFRREFGDPGRMPIQAIVFSAARR
jgi:hypothetical protein